MKSPDLSVQLGKLKFKNPILVASGTYGYAKEYERFYSVNQLGGIVTKTITIKPRIGNAPRRVAETPAGMINAIGLQNVGAHAFVADKLPYLRSLKIPIIVSIMGYSIDEFIQVADAVEPHAGVSGFELNLSCPNVKYGSKTKMFAHDANLIRQVVSAVRKRTKKTLIAKLGPDVSNIGDMAKAVEDGGADSVSLINTFGAMLIDIKTRRPVIGNVTGGLSGPCIRPIAVRMVHEAAKAVKIPVIGMGGISSVRDVVEFLIAGASLVQVGTINFTNPMICPELIAGLKDYLSAEKIKSVRELTGSIRL